MVPLIWGEPEDVTISKLEKLNGVLFPGGDDAFADLVSLVFEWAKNEND